MIIIVFLGKSIRDPSSITSADSNKLLNGELDKEFSSTILRAINRLDQDDKHEHKSASFLAPTIFPTPTATPSSSYTFPPTRTKPSKPSKGTPASPSFRPTRYPSAARTQSPSVNRPTANPTAQKTQKPTKQEKKEKDEDEDEDEDVDESEDVGN
jgi:hypothetical protein